MPASPEHLLALLEAPHWKAPGSTSRKAEGPTARRVEGSAAVNLTVVDHIAEGRQVLARAAKLNAEGSPLARREAAALRTAQAIKSELLMGNTASVRQHPCPACGCYSLLPKGERVHCVNRHCAPAGVQRRWNLRDLTFAGHGNAKRIYRTEGKPPRDLVEKTTAVAFFAPTGQPVSMTTLSRIIRLYDLPTWTRPGHSRAHYVSLSDVMTAHAVHMAGREPQACETSKPRAACTGLADLFFGGRSSEFTAQAKDLCDTCPLRDACLEEAMAMPVDQQHGIRGGLTASERLELKRTPTT